MANSAEQTDRIETSVLNALNVGDYSRLVLRSALEARGGTQEQIFALARTRRSQFFKNEQVEARSVIEISNVCLQSCNYCNMAKGSGVKRYVMPCAAVIEMADYLYDKGRRVILIQSGENRAETWVKFIVNCVSQIKNRHADLEIILCMGNLSTNQYRELKDAGADRYVIKFESSNPGLYHTWKPSDTLEERLACIQSLHEIGFKVGSGNMAGMPGQTIEDLVDDLLLVARLNLSMMSCTVFIPGENSNYREQPAGDVDLALNCMALMRIMNPDRLMPTTSCLERMRPGGQYFGLMAGANTITVHDGTPERFQEMFPIYSTHRFTPDKSHLGEAVEKAGLTISSVPLQ